MMRGAVLAGWCFGMPLIGMTLIAMALIAMALIAMPHLSHAQTAADDVAAQIRNQGYRCDAPISAARNARRSRPDSAVWLLKCANASYRVRLDPDMAARVTPLTKRSR